MILALQRSPADEIYKMMSKKEKGFSCTLHIPHLINLFKKVVLQASGHMNVRRQTLLPRKKKIIEEDRVGVSHKDQFQIKLSTACRLFEIC